MRARARLWIRRESRKLLDLAFSALDRAGWWKLGAWLDRGKLWRDLGLKVWNFDWWFFFGLLDYVTSTVTKTTGISLQYSQEFHEFLVWFSCKSYYWNLVSIGLANAILDHFHPGCSSAECDYFELLHINVLQEKHAWILQTFLDDWDSGP